MGNKELTFTFCCRKSLAERLEAQEDLNLWETKKLLSLSVAGNLSRATGSKEDLNIKGDKGNMGNKELTFTFCCRKSLAERLEAQEDLNIKRDKGNMGNKELTFTFCCRKSLAERLEAQEDLNIKVDKGNMGNKNLLSLSVAGNL